MNTMNVTVRFAETDALGHVNNTSYFIYMEDARLHLLKELGWDSAHSNWSFVLVSTKCDFINQAYFDQILRIDTSIEKVGTKSFHLSHDLFCDQTGTVIARGHAVIAYYNKEEKLSEPIPADLKDKLLQYLTA